MLLRMRCLIGVSPYHHLSMVFSSSWPAYMSIWHARSGVVMFRYPSRVQKDTRLCPYCCGSVLGPYYSYQLTLSPRDLTPPPPPPPPPPPLRPPVTSPGLLLSWFPSSLNAPTLPQPGPVHLCYPLPLPPLRLRSVTSLTALYVAVNLH